MKIINLRGYFTYILTKPKSLQSRTFVTPPLDLALGIDYHCYNPGILLLLTYQYQLDYPEYHSLLSLQITNPGCKYLENYSLTFENKTWKAFACKPVVLVSKLQLIFSGCFDPVHLFGVVSADVPPKRKSQ